MRTSWMSALAALAAMVFWARVCAGQEVKETRIDVGGYKLFTSMKGSGAPVVVFESGLGEDLSTWAKVIPDVASFTRTFAYDRAGLGNSEPCPGTKSIEQMVNELHAVLKASGIKPPYVLVGHSLGGATVQVFAHNYPSEVAGLVLVDPEDGRLLERLQSRLSEHDWDARQEILGRMMAAASAAQKAELEATKQSGRALETALPLPKVPTILLTGTLKDPGFPGNPTEQDLKLELHKEFLANVPQAKHVLVSNSRHYIQNDAPELVIRAIRDVVGQARISYDGNGQHPD